jgi:hypothetical protein
MIESAEKFIQLRDSDNPEDYNRSARDSASMDTWLELINNYPDYQEWVAHNKTIPDTIIELLSNSLSTRVRAIIASKRKTPTHILEKLSKDIEDSVRRSIVYNPKTPTYILTSMLQDNWQLIANKAKDRLML